MTQTQKEPEPRERAEAAAIAPLRMLLVTGLLPYFNTLI